MKNKVDQSKIHFVIYGVGAVGGSYGGQLAYYKAQRALEYNLTFLARGKTFEILKNDGISLETIDEKTETWLSKDINVVQGLTEIKFNDDEYPVFLLCVKSKDTQACAQDIAKLALKQDYAVVSVQNGIENEDILVQELGKEAVIGAYTNILAESLEPGKYTRKGKYWLSIGELDGLTKARTQAIYEQMSKAELVVKITEKIQIELWQKLVWNAGFNPASVFYEADLGQLFANPEACERIENIMRETKELALKLGYKINPEIDKIHFERTKENFSSDFKTSMLQDHLKNRPIELDQLLGVVVRKAQEINFPAPYATNLYSQMNSRSVI